MELLKDEKRLINIHPLMVYFLLEDDDYWEFADGIKKMSHHKSFTRGIFKFFPAKRLQSSLSGIPHEIAETIYQYNVMVRLVDDADGSFVYALHKADFNALSAQFETGIYGFLADACKHNIQALEALSERLDVEPKRKVMYRRLVGGFQQALDVTCKSGEWDKILHPSKMLADYNIVRPSVKRMTGPRLQCLSNSPFNRWIPAAAEAPSAFDVLDQENLTPRGRQALQKIFDVFVQLTGVPNEATSNAIATGVVNPSQRDALLADQRKRLNPPTITIAKVKYGVKGGKTRWGVKINDGNQEFSVDFKPTSLPIYLGTLLRQKDGERLHRTDFLKSANGSWQGMSWMKKLFKVLYPAPDFTFEEWYEKFKEGRGAGNNQTDGGKLSQYKSNCNKAIKDALGGKSDAVACCLIQMGERSSYYIDVPADHIIVPSEFQKLLRNGGTPLLLE